MKMIKFNIACINKCTKAEGPYKRLAIWFQGCDIHCDGCCNKSLQKLSPRHIIPIYELLAVVSDAKDVYGIEGVTYLGGEPTLQQGLAVLSKQIHQLNLGIILFTGKLLEELQPDLLQNIDMVIDGKFEAEHMDNTRNLIGSTNQRMEHITERYKECDDWFLIPRPKLHEVNIGDALYLTGDVL